jgi:hypothetical protein
MNKSKVLLLIGCAFVLFVSSLVGCARALVAIKGEPPQYIGLGEFENPNQGLNSTMYPKGTINPNPAGPVIKHAYAVDRGIYGAVLKIYIEAEDPKGEMEKIAVTVDQVGYGRYPTDFTILKPKYRKSFKGYIQWNTFSSRASNLYEWSRIFVTVAVIDKTGKASNEFVLPFTFETGVAPAPTPPEPFDQGNLPKIGNISINLFNPYHMGGGGDGGGERR